MRKVAILGTGHTKFAFAAEKTAVELLSEAALSAIIGSGLRSKDIEAMFVGNVLEISRRGKAWCNPSVLMKLAPATFPRAD